jgi:hypothetical protein
VKVHRLAGLTFALATSAVMVVGLLTVSLAQWVSPIHDPVSDYALYGGEPLFALAVGLMIAGGLAVRAAMTYAGLPGGRVLFGLWYTGLAIVAVFPGNRSATNTTVSGDIHRFGGALFLTCLPLACWSLARRLRDRHVRWFTAVSAVTAAAFGVSQFLQWLPLGLLERFALGAQLALLVVLASAVRRVAR